jgi:hypothetical protein
MAIAAPGAAPGSGPPSQSYTDCLAPNTGLVQWVYTSVWKVAPPQSAPSAIQAIDAVLKTRGYTVTYNSANGGSLNTSPGRYGSAIQVWVYNGQVITWHASTGCGQRS